MSIRGTNPLRFLGQDGQDYTVSYTSSCGYSDSHILLTTCVTYHGYSYGSLAATGKPSGTDGACCS